MFISYLTSAANDICKDAKRQTISAEDVFTALQDLDFGELINPTKDALEGMISYQSPHEPRCGQAGVSDLDVLLSCAHRMHAWPLSFGSTFSPALASGSGACCRLLWRGVHR